MLFPPKQQHPAAAAAETVEDRLDDFEVIEDVNAKKRDCELLVKQIHGLLKSQSIRIEEKGYLLSILHD